MHSPRWQLPPLELLLAFEAAARHLSFTKAAEELSLTQSAVSRQIQALEESLGGKLFERRTRALLLTENGQRLYQVAQERPAASWTRPRRSCAARPRRAR